MVLTSAQKFSLAVDAMRLIHRACAEINNLPRSHSQIPDAARMRKPKLLVTCTIAQQFSIKSTLPYNTNDNTSDNTITLI